MQTATPGFALQSQLVQATGNVEHCISHYDNAATCKALPDFAMTNLACVHMITVLGT